MSEIPLNKFEKEKRVIELHNQGKTIREIAQELRTAFRDIGRKIKKYEKQQAAALKEKPEDDSSYTKKKLSKSSQAYALFRNGKTAVEVAIDLDLDF